MENLKKELIRLLARGEILEAVLNVGGIRDSAFDSKPYLQSVGRLTKSIGRRGSLTTTTKIETINAAIFKRLGMSIGTGRPRLVIDDPDRFFIDRVIDKRVGSPLAMAVLYWAVADAVGLKCDCLALPSYYLLRVMDGKRELFIDPFEGGRIMNPDEFQRKFRSAFTRSQLVSTSLFERITPVQLVARLIQQLKQVYVLKSNPLFALRAVDLLIGLFPESPEFARDRGILYCEMEYFSKAADDLSFYLERRKSADDLPEIKRLSKMLKGYREIVN